MWRQFFNKERLVTIALALLVSLGVNLGASGVATHFWQPKPPLKIATVELKDIVQDFVVTLAKRKDLSSAQVRAKVEVFQNRLQARIDSLSRQYNLVVLSKSAVLSKVPDLTIVFKRKRKQ